MKRTEAQQAVIDDRGGTLLVAAAAGSGKTSVLVERLLTRVQHEGARVDQFLIITFTKAAAEELRQRIGRSLAELIRENPENAHLRRQSVLLYQAQISTIHALGTQLLREWGHLLDIPQDFALCEEEEGAVLLRQALEDLLETRYEALDEKGDFAQLLDLLSFGRDDTRLQEITLDLYARMQSHADPLAWMQEQLQLWNLAEDARADETAWGKLLLEESKRQIDYWEGCLEAALARIATEPTLAPYAETLADELVALAEFREATQQGWDEAAACTISFGRLKAVRGCEDPVLQEQIKAIRNQCKDAMGQLKDRFSASSAALMEDIRLLYPAIRALFALITDLEARYDAIKKKRSLLDFNDLEHKTVSLLCHADGRKTELAQQLSTHYVEIMVDEYQDTNSVQNLIFSALSQQEQNLFLVGDVKQSIYRFRLADPGIFLEKYRCFLPHSQASAGESRKILLSQNFRSRPEVLDATNALFYAIMSEQLGEMNYTQEEALYPGGNFCEGAGYATEFHVLNYGEEEDGEEEHSAEEKAQRPNSSESEACFVASSIARLLREGFPVSDGAGGTRPVKPDDIAILLRSPSAVRHHYSKALRELQIPWSSEQENSFFESSEVSVMLSFLQIIDNPHHDVALLAVMHSPLYAFDAERLAQLRLAAPGELYAALEAAAQDDALCRAFLEELESLRFEAIDLSCRALLWLLFERCSALELFARLPGGEERRENLYAFYDLACRYEKAGHRGLFGFLHHLERLRENGHSPTRSAAGTGGGVKLLSIHRSKGLEYPVVFLSGLGRKFNVRDMQKSVLFHQKLGIGPRAVDAERQVEFTTLPREALALQLRRDMLAEEMRLLYVAMTRAKDKLIITCSLSHGEGDLKKLGLTLSWPLSPHLLASCSCAGHWLLLAAMTRPEAAVLRRIAKAQEPLQSPPSSRPWLVRYHTGTVPLAAALDEVQEQADCLAPLPREELWARLAYRYPNERLAGIPAKITASDLMKKAQHAHGEEQKRATAFSRPQFAAARSGLTATQRGLALHTAMQSLRLARCDSPEGIAEELSRLEAQAFLSPEAVASLSAQQIFHFFASPVGQRMRAAKNLHREFPFSIPAPAEDYYEDLPSGELLLFQGVIDCWFEEERGITLLDFKTNRVSQDNLLAEASHYRPQLLAYAKALSLITGLPVRQKILCFLAANTALILNESEEFEKVF